MRSRLSQLYKIAALLSVFLIADVRLHQAQAGECPQFSLPHIGVDIQRDDVREAFDISIGELLHPEAASQSQGHRALGMYRSKIGYKFDMDLDLRVIGPEEYCALPKALHIILFVKDRTIHFAQETRHHPCIVAHTRAHELLHAHADDEVIEAAAVHIAQEFGKKIATASLLTAPSYEVARRELARAVTEKMTMELDAIEAVRNQINREVDSTASLTELLKACADPGADR